MKIVSAGMQSSDRNLGRKRGKSASGGAETKICRPRFEKSSARMRAAATEGWWECMLHVEGAEDHVQTIARRRIAPAKIFLLPVAPITLSVVA